LLADVNGRTTIATGRDLMPQLTPRKPDRHKGSIVEIFCRGLTTGLGNSPNRFSPDW
jgi:hypothetical protein